MKVFCNERAGAGGRPKEPEEEFVFPEDPNVIVLDPRIDMNSIVGSNDYVSDGEFEEDMVERVNLLSESDSK